MLNHLWSVVDDGCWPSMEIARATGSNECHIPRVDFVAETDSCPICGAPTVIARSKKRTVVTYAAGMFDAVEIQKKCSVVSFHSLIKSKALAQIVRPHQRFGYDLIVQVGLLRYLKRKQREEICEKLFQKRSIKLSTGTVSNLCNYFLIYLEALHLVRSPHLKAAIQEHGYPLHIDATSEHGKGGLFVCMDGFRNWVLCAGKIESESEDTLKPFIEKTIDLFSYPIGVVRDLGAPGKNAVAFLVKKGIPDFVCHYHFLGAIGKKLFDSPYALLRNLLRQSLIRTDLKQLLKEKKLHRGKDPDCIRENLLALLHWVIEGDGKKDVMYPFSLPHLEFFQRCQIAMKCADIWVPMPRNQAECRTLRHLEGLIQQLVKEKGFQEVVGSLEIGWQAFTSARNSLRLTDAELPRGDKRYQQIDLPVIEAKRLKEIEKQVELYLSELRKIVGNESLKRPVSPHGIILKYFTKYSNQLFGHPVILDDNRTVIAVVQRTNNVNEHFFGNEKQRLRRRVGRAHLGRDLEDQPAQVALAANLRHPDYVSILCGSLEHLHIAFANLDEYALSDTTPLVRSNRDTVLQKRVRILLKNLCESDALNEERPDHDQISPFTPVV